jgi:hypothetical protein
MFRYPVELDRLELSSSVKRLQDDRELLAIAEELVDRSNR